MENVYLNICGKERFVLLELGNQTLDSAPKYWQNFVNTVYKDGNRDNSKSLMKIIRDSGGELFFIQSDRYVVLDERIQDSDEAILSFDDEQLAHLFMMRWALG